MEMNAVDNIASGLQNGTTAAPVNEPQTLADVIGVSEASAEQQTATETQPAQPQQQEPGWFKGRMEKERAKWESDRQAEMTRMEERQNALLERIIARDAQDLVDSGEFKSLERATEYLRMKEGLPVNQQPSQTTQQPRDAQGRFTQQIPQDPGPAKAAQQRAQELVNQAESLRRATGVDVMAIYNTNQQARDMILSGGKDFVDVLQAFGNPEKQQHVPISVRAANGVAVGQTQIGKMTDTQFATMNDFLSKGGKIDMR